MSGASYFDFNGNGRSTNNEGFSRNRPVKQHEKSEYTLPGVINYLTSEFTDLERFKIFNNIEKSEMRSKINQLQSEVDTLKLTKEKQRTQLDELRKKNRQLHLKLGEEVPGKEDDEGEQENEPGSNMSDMLDVDLNVIKSSRERLTKTVANVMQLMKPPVTGQDVLEMIDSSKLQKGYGELINNNDDNFGFLAFDRDENQDKNQSLLNSDIFSRYLHEPAGDFYFRSSGSLDEKRQQTSHSDNSDYLNFHMTEDEEEKEIFPDPSSKSESDNETLMFDEKDSNKNSENDSITEPRPELKKYSLLNFEFDKQREDTDKT